MGAQPMGDDRRTHRPTVEYDHHSREMALRGDVINDEVRSVCPVTWTESYGGHWVVTGYEAMSAVVRDDATFCSSRSAEGSGGVAIPSGVPTGMTETDPPRFRQIRSQLNPMFTQAAVELLKPEILDYTTACIDSFIESGECDFLTDLTSPVPAILTVRMLGLPMEDWRRYADVLHRIIATGFEDGPEGAEVAQLLDWFRAQTLAVAQARREEPKDDLISLLTHMEVDGERFSMEDVMANIFLLAGGGVDTTTGLMSHTLRHLTRDRAAREWLMEDSSRLTGACEEYLRYFSPVQSLARTVTTETEMAGQTMEPNERVLISWAGANHDPAEFDAPDEIRLDRTPNRHAAFGLGIHRCLGSNVARVVWSTVIGEVLRRIPDFEVDESRVIPYQSIGIINGLHSVPATFTPGARIGSTFTV
jgi:cytochrome P450